MCDALLWSKKLVLQLYHDGATISKWNLEKDSDCDLIIMHFLVLHLFLSSAVHIKKCK